MPAFLLPSVWVFMKSCFLTFGVSSMAFSNGYFLIGVAMSFLALSALVAIFFFRYRRLKKECAHCSEELSHAQQSNQSKDKLFSIVAHDLRSPFNSLMGLSEMLILQSESMNHDQVQYYSKMVHNSTSKLYTLVEDLLQWSRTQNGSTACYPEKLDLNILTTNIVNLLRISAQEKDIVIALKMEDRLEAFADSNIYSTVLRNLISNAIKFSKVGSTIQVSGIKRDDGVIEMTVADRGIGMDAIQLENVFKIEGSQSTSGTLNEPSSGLGLILCKEFVEINKGEIVVDSQSGVGTTVRFTIPSMDYSQN
jgi:two-component system, sensor histidine kinase and response regulator